MTIAKGITSSQIPAGGVVVSKDIAAYMDSVRWNHVSTFAAHPIAMAAAQANIEYMIENDIPEMSRKAGEYFGARLRELEKAHKTVGFVAGAGMFWQVELVKDKETREAFIPEDRYTAFAGDTSIWPDPHRPRQVPREGRAAGRLHAQHAAHRRLAHGVEGEDMDKALDALDYALDYLDSTVKPKAKTKSKPKATAKAKGKIKAKR